MPAQPEEAPGRWDLEWEPVRGSAAPERFPPSLEAAYAEFPLRALAFLVDVLLVWLLVQVLLQARSLLVFSFTRDTPQAEGLALAVSGLLVVLTIGLSTMCAAYFWRVFRATPGQMAFGLFVLQRASGLPLRRRAAILRWLLLYVPLVSLLSYAALVDIVFRTEFAPDGDPLLLASAAVFLPAIWYAILAISVLIEKRRGRGLHDRLSGSVVVRRAGPPI